MPPCRSRRVALGSLLFKLVGSLIILPLSICWQDNGEVVIAKAELVSLFPRLLHLVRCLVMLPFVDPMARFAKRLFAMNRNWIPSYGPNIWMSARWIRHACSGERPRETLRIGDAMEQMMEGLNKVMHGEPRQEKELRKLADDINVLYTAIKLYLARMPKKVGGGRVAPLGGDHRNGRSTLNSSDIVERMGSEIADKSLAARRAFSLDGLKNWMPL
ncbi:putative transporter [Escherichia coli]|uniref:Putative transporter n=1 Tax=Escherichia coli TaxID=562 RepID=A0A376U023_ECOLX|nr:putative transporter [Escherichia coli]